MELIKSPSPLKRLAAGTLKAYYGDPAKDLSLIVIIESKDSHVSDLLLSIFRIVGKKAKGANIKSFVNLHRTLSTFWRDGADIAVLKIPQKVLSKHALTSLPIHTAVLVEPDHSAMQLLMMNSPSNVILNHDDANHTFYRELAPDALSFGHSTKASLQITREKLYKDGSEAALSFGTSAPLMAASILNSKDAPLQMAAATLVAKLLNIESEDILDGLAFWEPDKE